MTGKQNIAATQSFGKTIDFGKTASDYRNFRAGFPSEFFNALSAKNYISSDQSALDIGTGTGTVARGLAQKGLIVTGIDPAQALLDEAAELDKEAGVSIRYRTGSAESLTEADDSFDLLTAGQCWHWFVRAKAAQEAKRVLKPHGRIIIAHFDWLPFAGNVVEATEQLILKYNPKWTMGGGGGIYPQWLQDLAEASFSTIETFSFDLPVYYSHEAWRGRIRASAGVKASLSPEETTRFDCELAQILQKDFAENPQAIPHRVWAVTALNEK
ncbi:class I SAM-dependent methyltransferase [Ochrobactrum sp. GRS2]|nr:class I SAM-dependent methyltransferase [Ochrobactrum sp. GRS2]